MGYIDGFVMAVPAANKQAFLNHARGIDGLFLELGATRSELEAAGRPIGPYDLLIAGQARAREMVLVTANSREFRRVNGLECEDWPVAPRRSAR